MNDARPLFDPGFTEHLPHITDALAPAVSDLPAGGGHWVFYGSQPLGLARQGSDLNALLLLDDFRGVPHRRDGRWAMVPVTIHVLSRDQFTADGVEGRYGGYFALKLLAPFMSCRASDAALLGRTTAGFLGPFAEAVADRWYRPARTSDQLLAPRPPGFSSTSTRTRRPTWRGSGVTPSCPYGPGGTSARSALARSRW